MSLRLFLLTSICSLCIHQFANAACFTEQEASWAECQRDFSITKDNECEQLYTSNEKTAVSRKSFIDCKYKTIEQLRNGIDQLKYKFTTMTKEKYEKSELDEVANEIQKTEKDFNLNLLKTDKGQAYENEYNTLVPYAFLQVFKLSSTDSFADPQNGCADMLTEQVSKKLVNDFVDILNKSKCSVSGTSTYKTNTWNPNEWTVNVVGSCPKGLNTPTLLLDGGTYHHQCNLTVNFPSNKDLDKKIYHNNYH